MAKAVFLTITFDLQTHVFVKLVLTSLTDSLLTWEAQAPNINVYFHMEAIAMNINHRIYTGKYCFFYIFHIQ